MVGSKHYKMPHLNVLYAFTVVPVVINRKKHVTREKTGGRPLSCGVMDRGLISPPAQR